MEKTHTLRGSISPIFVQVLFVLFVVCFSEESSGNEFNNIQQQADSVLQLYRTGKITEQQAEMELQKLEDTAKRWKRAEEKRLQEEKRQQTIREKAEATRQKQELETEARRIEQMNPPIAPMKPQRETSETVSKTVNSPVSDERLSGGYSLARKLLHFPTLFGIVEFILFSIIGPIILGIILLFLIVPAGMLPIFGKIENSIRRSRQTNQGGVSFDETTLRPQGISRLIQREVSPIRTNTHSPAVHPRPAPTNSPGTYTPRNQNAPHHSQQIRLPHSGEVPEFLC